jgi:hypothetical protein
MPVFSFFFYRLLGGMLFEPYYLFCLLLSVSLQELSAVGRKGSRIKPSANDTLSHSKRNGGDQN